MLRNGEQLLLTIIIPTVLLILFASAPIADLPKPRIDFLVPGVLALAVMSTAFTGQAIGTGFERKYGVLRRLGTTPMAAVHLAAREDRQRALRRGPSGGPALRGRLALRLVAARKPGRGHRPAPARHRGVQLARPC